ncbi:MAG: CYTH domain-containing protein [Planctomycetota bacterium]|jgi:CYTH domain-containing protein
MQEIERKFLLTACPEIPAEAEVLRIEQGYLPPDAGGLGEGRLRRIVRADGRTEHVFTVKRGRGLVREEYERDLTEEEFAAQWPDTVDARIRKTRYELRLADGLWVVDVFDDRDLLLAEVELPTVDAPCEPPGWLVPTIDREVTDDPAYTNRALATRQA